MSISKNKPVVWHIGGEDVRMRIPILKKLRSLGFDVAAVGSEGSEPFDRAEITYYRYQLKRGISPLSDQHSITELAELFSRHCPDVVHAFDTKPAVLVPRAAHRAGLKGTIRTVTGMGYIFSSTSPLALMLRPIYRHMQRRASALSDRTVFQNEDDMAYFTEKKLVNSEHAVLVRGSGVDLALLEQQINSASDQEKLRQELGLENSLVVIMVARLVNHKGVLEYLNAARQVRKVLPEIRFLLVGPRADEGRQAVPESMIESFQDCVDWLGARPDVPSLLSLSHVFVLPSYYREGVPRVLLEAGGLGLPLITTDMPGCRDVVINGETGLLVPPRNSELLADAMIKLLNSETLRKEMGAKARNHIARSFTLDKVASLYAGLYHEIIN